MSSITGDEMRGDNVIMSARIMGNDVTAEHRSPISRISPFLALVLMIAGN
jgi:hypothetical protein